jgi:hypothetical protein
MKKLAVCFAFIALCFVSSYAQPRLIANKVEKTPPAIAPITFVAKYEGGMFGFSKKEEGTLKFDDANFRLVFFDKSNKERFGIPYKDLIVIYPHSQSVQSTTGKVVQNVPLLGAGILGGFIKEKRRYLVLNFDDPDMDIKGTVNFKLENKELLDSVVQTLGTKAELQPRGDAYYRPQKKQKPVN